MEEKEEKAPNGHPYRMEERLAKVRRFRESGAHAVGQETKKNWRECSKVSPGAWGKAAEAPVTHYSVCLVDTGIQEPLQIGECICGEETSRFSGFHSPDHASETIPASGGAEPGVHQALPG